MAYYYCGQPGCRGHETFSENCSNRALLDYAPLIEFQEWLDTQEIFPVALEPADPQSGPTRNTKDYFAFWREQ